jgi:hypothetical protein
LFFGDQIIGSLSRDGAGTQWGEESGSYNITQGSLTAGLNYNLTMTPGTLFYINPHGPGTRAVKPVLNCIRDLGDGLFEANFSYSNENDMPVFIPAETAENLIEGTGLDEEYVKSVQPEVFLPGGPMEEIKIFFDGFVLSWSISSREDEKKASNAASANSSSTKCKGNNKDKKTASVFGSASVEELDPNLLLAYPIPVVDKVHITMKDIEHYKTITMYDMTGRQHHITSIDKRADNLEIDMAQLPAGYYIFKIVMEDSTRVVQIIKK